MEHSGGGKGRAGTVAACLVLQFGRRGIWARIYAENASNDAGRSLRPRAPFMTSEEDKLLLERRLLLST